MNMSNETVAGQSAVTEDRRKRDRVADVAVAPYHSSPTTDQSVRFWGSTDLCGAGRSIGVHGAAG